MSGKSDQELLREYTGRGVQAAFSQLVHRHVNLVYFAALRLVKDRHLAEDVTQAVFVGLARDAWKLASRPVLVSWLHVTTRNLAAKTVRTEVRRRAREQEAITMQNDSSGSVSVWGNIAPLLDDALARINDADRSAILLRFIEGKSARRSGSVST